MLLKGEDHDHAIYRRDGYEDEVYDWAASTASSIFMGVTTARRGGYVSPAGIISP